MTNNGFRVVLIGGWLAIFHLSLTAPVEAQNRTPNFSLGVAQPDGTGQNDVYWLGGDSPQGTYISPNYSFWGFSDTYLSDPNATGRHILNPVYPNYPDGSPNSDIPGNTIAIGQTNSQINNGNFTPYYFYSGTIAYKKAFFPNPAPGYRYLDSTTSHVVW